MKISIFKLFKYHLFSFWNWRSSYLGKFIEPFAYIFFLSAGISGIMSRDPNAYSFYVLSGIVTLLGFRSAISSMSDVSNDRKWGVYAIYAIHGGKPSGYLLSIIIFSIFIYTVQFLLSILSVAIVFGGGIFAIKSLYIYFIGLISVFGWSCIGALVGSRVDSYSARDFIVTISTIPAVFTAPLFYPIYNSQGLLYAISLVNPLSYTVYMIRNFSFESFLILLVISIILYILCLKFLATSDKLSRER